MGVLYLSHQTNKQQTLTTMNTTNNINSYCETITDARLIELMPEVPADVPVAFYGHVRTRQTGYGTWRIIVELDINSMTEQFGFTSHDEQFMQMLRGHDKFTAEEQADALDTALLMALDRNEGDVMEALLTAKEAMEEADGE